MVSERRHHLLRCQLWLPTRDRLELVDGAAGVAEGSASQLRNCDPERGNEGSEDERDLVADTTGRVLVDRRLTQMLKVELGSRGHHRAGQRAQLCSCHAVFHHGAREFGHRRVGDFATRVTGYERRGLG